MTPKREPMWRRYLRFFGPNVAADVNDEVDDHIARLESELRAQGVPETEITGRVRARFGDADAIRARLRRSDEWRHRRGRRIEALGSFGQDIAYALRRLRQRPGFTATVVIVLALGIGATTAMFSAVDAAVLEPLPFPRADRLVILNDLAVPFKMPSGIHNLSYLAWGDVAAMKGTFSHLAQYDGGGMNLAVPGHPVRVQAGVVTTDFFGTMGVQPVQGRGFTAHEDREDAPRVVVLSDALWHREFGGRPMLDSTISLTGRAYTVIGIMPPGFNFPAKSDLWIPLPNPNPMSYDGWRPNMTMEVVARLADGVTFEQAFARYADLWERSALLATQGDSAATRTARSDVATLRQNGMMIPVRRQLVGNRRTPLLFLAGATGLLLLIACANVGGLLLSQAATRRREIAMRGLLGATRARLMRQLLIESVILALPGAVLGLALVPLALHELRTLMPAGLSGILTPRVDLRVLIVALVASVACGVAFGLWPARHLARTELDGGRAMSDRSAGASPGRSRRILLGVELAVTVVLLVATGLLLRSFAALTGVDTGFRMAQVTTVQMSLDATESVGPMPFDASGRTNARRLLTINAILRDLRRSPGIEAAGAVNALPIAKLGGVGFVFKAVGDPSGRTLSAEYLAASPGYFDAMGVALLRGRDFRVADDSTAPPVIIINRVLAERGWPGENPVGRQIDLGKTRPTIIGVVAAVRDDRLAYKPDAQMYFPIFQRPSQDYALVVRSARPTSAVLATIQNVVHGLDPAQALYGMRSMANVVHDSVAPQRANARLIAVFGGLALLLSALGVYAMVAAGVTQRRRELGIRSALGATGHNLAALVSGEVVRTTLIALALGLVSAWLGARIVASLLYGVTPHDAASYMLAPVALCIPVAVAAWLPARRAARTNPVDVMREE